MKLQDKINPNLPFVIYKKSNSGRLVIWQQKNDAIYTDKLLKTQGYYFAPFDFSKHSVLVFPVDTSIRQDALIRDFDADLAENMIDLQEDNSSEAKNHQHKVSQAIDKIRSGRLQKIIVSRKQKIDYQQFNEFQTLLQLMHQYDTSYVYLWHHPKVGTWMGATPEVLVHYDGHAFETMALAGTLPVKEQEIVTWTPKEIVEQQIVTDYISKQLSRFSKEVYISKAKTVFQGKIAHIQTRLSASIPVNKLPELILQLHPTPAVCGIPVPEAKKTIPEIEAYDRKYYTGFLGVLSTNEASLYVNLRCFEIENETVNLYVGGGIVQDSNPEMEWKETQLKAKVVLRGLQKNS